MTEEIDGANVIASRVGMDISEFIQAAEKMGTVIENLNAQLKTIEMPKISMSTSGEGLGAIAAAQQSVQSNMNAVVENGLSKRNAIEETAMAKSSNSYQNYFDKLKGMTQHHIDWFMTGGLLMFGGEIFKSGIVDFDKGLAGVQQVLEETYQKMGKTLSPEVMGAIGQNFAVIAERWGQSIQEILQGAKDWGRQYKDINTIQELVNSTTLLSVVDNLTLADSVKGLEATMNQWNMVATNSAQAQEYSMRVVDSWSAVAHKSMISAQDLAQGNEKAGASARMMGIDFDHLQGMLAAGVRATGRSGNELGNTLKTMFASIHSDKAVTELKKLGVAVKDTAGNFRPAQAVFEDLMIKMAGTKQNIEEVVQAVSSGKFQWSKAAALLGDYDTYIKATAQSINSAGLAQQYMAVQMDTVSRKAGQLHQALIALVNSSGNSGLTGVIKVLLDNLKYLVDGLNNGGVKAVAFGLGVVGLAKAMQTVQTALNAAETAQKSFNAAIAIGDALAGNFVGLIAAAAVVGVSAYTIGLGKASDAQADLTDKQKQSAEQHKQMSDQYGREIDFITQLEDQHTKLSKAVQDSSNTAEQKARINKDLQATEDALSTTIGDEGANAIKSAGYTHAAFQNVVTSLQGKQNAEKVAWKNSQQLVTEATLHLQQNVQAQIKSVQEAAKAYDILAKLQEAGLAAHRWLDNANVFGSQTMYNLTGSDYYKQQLELSKAAVANDDANINQFYLDQRNKELNKLYADAVKIGGTVDPSALQDIPDLGSGFNNAPMDSTAKAKKGPKGKSLETLAKEAEAAAKKMRELNITMEDNKIGAYTDDVKILDAYMKTQGETLGNLIKKETDYHYSVIETRNERALVQSQIKELSSDTAKYGDEIEKLKKKDGELAVQEQDLINKQAEMIAQKIKAGYQEEQQAEEAAVQAKIDSATKEQKAYDDNAKAQQEAISAQIKSIDNAITANDDYYNNLIKPMQDQLTALDKTNKALDEQNKLLDLRNNLEKLYQERNNIEAEKSVRVYQGGQWTYQADQSKLNDVNKRITDAQKAITDQETTMSRDAEKQTIQDRITTYENLRDAQKKSLTDAKGYQQSLLEISQQQQKVYDDTMTKNIADLNTQKTALGTYWKGVLDDTKINQDALSLLQNTGYDKSLKDADKYYTDAKKALDSFGVDAMASAKKIHDQIAASLAIASTQNVNIAHDNSVNIGQISTTSNLAGVLSAARQLAAM